MLELVKTTETVWLPTPSVLIMSFAFAIASSVIGAPTFAPSIRNCAVPVGFREPKVVFVTVAVNVTDVPAVEG